MKKQMKPMTPPLRVGGLVLGMLVVISSCLSGMEQVGGVSTSPTDDPGLREGAATVSAAPASPGTEGLGANSVGRHGERVEDDVDPEGGAATALSAPAFPGAEGFGANSVGGRGGRVIEVTNLNDSGPGSLRAAVEAVGPRIVVFRTGGTIELRSPFVIINPFITVAGQTAPGGGITLKNASLPNPKSPLDIHTHDVIVRYIRVRPGPGGRRSAITIDHNDAYRVIVDHCSVSWAVDENVTTWNDPHDITIQWCIIAEGLSNSTHPQGEHSCGTLLGSDGSHSISIHHNLFVHNNERNPRIKTSGLVDFVNNVIYNYGFSAGALTNDYSDLPVNYVGNFVKTGPDSRSEAYELNTGSPTDSFIFSVYVSGNIGPHRPRDDMDESLVVQPDDRGWIVPTRHSAPLVTTTSAFEAYDQVLAGAGATIGLDIWGSSYWRRDAVDERIVNDVRNGSGRIIDDPSEVGGWPELAAGTAPSDIDRDGMPDAWECLWGFDPCGSSDGPGDADGDGYTNVEEYLNETDPGQGQGTGSCSFLFLPIVVR